MEEAVHQGAAPAQAANAIWVVALAGGFVSNGGYCVFRLNWSGTWLNFGRACSVSEYVLSSLMGILFTGGLLLYGWGVTGLGDLGAAIGWPLFQATMILFSSGLGIAMGEWRTVEPRIFRTNSFGLAIVLAAIIILSIGNRM
jgi:L-rhamnose-H+ transport protein